MCFTLFCFIFGYLDFNIDLDLNGFYFCGEGSSGGNGSGSGGNGNLPNGAPNGGPNRPDVPHIPKSNDNRSDRESAFDPRPDRESAFADLQEMAERQLMNDKDYSKMSSQQKKQIEIKNMKDILYKASCEVADQSKEFRLPSTYDEYIPLRNKINGYARKLLRN
jgi:hypothetical protein